MFGSYSWLSDTFRGGVGPGITEPVEFVQIRRVLQGNGSLFER